MSHKQEKRARRRERADSWHAIHRHLESIMRDLRREVAARLKRLRVKHPNHASPCETCAFRSSTDGFAGFELTVINLCAALADDRTFYCHKDLEIVDGEYMPDPKAEPCIGWMILQSDPPFDPWAALPHPLLETFSNFVEQRHENTRMPDTPKLEKGPRSGPIRGCSDRQEAGPPILPEI